MTVTRSTGRFPTALRSSARPRWSHRDPVEAGNPFPPADARHEVWEAATPVALEALTRTDRALDAAERAGESRVPYRDRVIELAVSRFDVWAQRLGSIVRDRAALEDYEAWLAMYVINWLAYVAETCPRVDVGDELRRRLSARAQHWAASARRTV